MKDTITTNSDGSLTWDSDSRTLTAFIPTTSTLEQYLHGKLSERLNINNSLKDSIDYYAAKLFIEIRNANIAFATHGEVYNVEKLESLNVLDSLQHIALSRELRKFAIDTIKSCVDSTTTILSHGGKITRPTIDILEDQHLVDFHCELSRSLFLCLLKDRALQSDMPSMFTLAGSYLPAYFTCVPAMNIKIFINRVPKIYSDDILDRKCFAWYNYFVCLCTKDWEWNVDNYKNRIMKLLKDLDAYYNTMLKESKPAVTFSNSVLKNCKNAMDSTSYLASCLKAFINAYAHDSEYYKSKLSELDRIYKSVNTIAVDQSIKQLIDNVLNTLLPIMEKNTTCIYNNDFENICISLIEVSAMRGNDITNDTERFSKYLSKKYELYNRITNINNAVKKEEIENKLKKLFNIIKQNNRRAKNGVLEYTHH